jgi:putative addiction module component (TIGR02574 family)
MSPANLAELLKLPAGERAELAMALWESLSDEPRDAELQLDQAERAELDRRWAQHVADRDSAVPWHDVKRTLRDGM